MRHLPENSGKINLKEGYDVLNRYHDMSCVSFLGFQICTADVFICLSDVSRFFDSICSAFYRITLVYMRLLSKENAIIN